MTKKRLLPLDRGRFVGETGCFGTNEVGMEGERATLLVYGAPQ
jgi:hypothetical protein